MMSITQQEALWAAVINKSAIQLQYGRAHAEELLAGGFKGYNNFSIPELLKEYTSLFGYDFAYTPLPEFTQNGIKLYLMKELGEGWVLARQAKEGLAWQGRDFCILHLPNGIDAVDPKRGPFRGGTERIADGRWKGKLLSGLSTRLFETLKPAVQAMCRLVSRENNLPIIDLKDV